MERKPQWILFLFALLALSCLLGFLQTYFMRFGAFESIPVATHFHFAVFLIWTAFILYQPYLIKKRQISRHKTWGKFSYFLVPVLVLSIWIMAFKILETRGFGADAIRSATGALLDSISFGLFYVLSLRNSKNTPRHAAYSIGSSLIVFNPGIGRFVANLTSNQLAVLIMILIPILFPLLLALFEKIRLGRAFLKSPYLIVIGIWLLEIIAFILLPQTTIWTTFLKNLMA